MARKSGAIKREFKKDLKYGDEIVTRMISNILKKGKKSLAERMVYGMFDIIQEKTKKDPLEVFRGALENIKPLIEVKPRRVGGSTYQVPVEVSSARQIALALRWIITYGKARKGKAMSERLALEVIDAYNKTGASIKKKEDVHKMAEANRAFAHYRW